MKMVLLVFSGILIMITGISCFKNVIDSSTPKGFTGKWTLVEIYGNDYWGGPAYWKKSNPDTKIEFTSDGKYNRKYHNDTAYTFIGSYQVLSDSTIKITAANPVSPSYPSYTFYYTFSAGGYMSWGNFGTEAIIKEKYKLDQ